MTPSAARSAAAFAALLLAAPAARAGDVTGEVSKQTLVLRGDDLGASLILAPPDGLRARGAVTVIRVTPVDGTTLNGSVDSAGFAEVVNVKLELGDGTDSVQLLGVTLGGDLSYDGGDGSNALYVDGSTIGGSCSFKSGDGADLLSVAGAAGCADDVKILLRDGVNEVRLLAGSTFGDDVSLKLGSGGDEVTLDTTITGSAKLSLGAGNNILNAPGSVGDDFSCKGGADGDTVSFSGFRVTGQAKLQLGPGTNSLALGPSLVGDTTIGESLKLKGGTGNDTVTTDGAEIGDDLSLILSSGDNSATVMNTSVVDDLIVKAKGGTDVFNQTGNTIGGETIVKGVP